MHASYCVSEDVAILGKLQQDVGRRGWGKSNKKHTHIELYIFKKK